ncbi:ABC transporter permease [Deinococcus sp. YIM 77859]|uniref:ABC transporter permease n=1 Tax=Deinococcus sp. YIM 77859 TaxID=1540221 RepID=UPI0018CED269|nr:ABC transporter permease [Deinococcus sp. YIM 77859]
MASSSAPALTSRAKPPPAGGLKSAVALLLSTWMGRTGMALLLLLFLAGAGPWIAPYDAAAQTGAPFSVPSAAHWLGTNDIGQDILSELIVGTRVSLTIGFTAAALAILIGTLVGVIAGFLGGRTDAALMRLVDVVLVLPFIPLMIVLAAFFGASSGNLIIAISLLIWARPARVIRSSALGIRSLAYVEGAQALGASNLHILWKHVLPGVLPIAVSQFILAASSSILIEASLAFLGLGDPVRKSWGTVLYYAQIRGAFLNGSWPWWVVPPGVLISMAVLGFALTGRAIETALFPRLQQRS